MLFHEFGDRSAPTLMLVPGAYVTWRMFERAIPTLTQTFRVIAVGMDGFEPDDDTEYESAVVAAERIVTYVKDRLGGRLFAIYGASLGAHPAFYAARDERITIEHVVLDGAMYVDTGILTPLTARLESSFARLLAGGRASSLLRGVGLKARDPGEAAGLLHLGRPSAPSAIPRTRTPRGAAICGSCRRSRGSTPPAGSVSARGSRVVRSAPSAAACRGSR